MQDTAHAGHGTCRTWRTQNTQDTPSRGKREEGGGGRPHLAHYRQELDGQELDDEELDGEELDGEELDGEELDGEELGGDGAPRTTQSGGRGCRQRRGRRQRCGRRPCRRPSLSFPSGPAGSGK